MHLQLQPPVDHRRARRAAQRRGRLQLRRRLAQLRPRRRRRRAGRGCRPTPPPNWSPTWARATTSLQNFGAASATGWSLAAIDCDDPDGGTITDRQMANEFDVDLDPGEQITCTFSYSRQSITVVLDALPNDAADFSFGVELAQLRPRRRRRRAGRGCRPTPPPNWSPTWARATTSLQNFGAASATGWSLAAIDCDDPDGGTITDRQMANEFDVDLDPGEQITCTFSYSRQSITVVLDALPNDAADFSFGVDSTQLRPRRRRRRAGRGCRPTPPPNWSPTWARATTSLHNFGAASATGWSLAAIDCDDPDGGTITDRAGQRIRGRSRPR